MTRPPLPRLGGAVACAAGAAVLLVALGGALAVALPAREDVWAAPLGLAIGLPVLAVVASAIRGGQDRAAWLLLLAGLGLTGAAGELGLPGGHGVPSVAWAPADVLWLLRFPVLYGAVALLIASHSPRFGVRQVLDGLVGAFAAGALLQLLVVPWMTSGAQAEATTVTLRSLYPLLDVLVVGFLVGAAALNGWSARVWVPLAADMTLFLACQVVALRLSFVAPGEPLGWSTYPGFLLAAWCMAAAAFALQREGLAVERDRRPVAPSLVLAGGAVATLVAASATGAGGLAIGLAAAALVAGLVRQGVTVHDIDGLLARTEREAATDALTGLANRRALTADLEAASARATVDRPLTLALFDLDGFKRYNDTFGHPAGDALLTRLGSALFAAVHPHGRAYRMGGDEFCLLIGPGGAGDDRALVGAGRTALVERGEGFLIGASCGVASLPADARTPMDALRLADQRMYAEKGVGRRRAPEHDATAVLLQLVRERDPALGDHIHEVAGWAAAVARRLGAAPDVVEQARLGGELHDVGKTSIPDAILAKPGPLTDTEWEFMRRHTVIGERILLADSGLAHVAPVARSHHERWEGGGYPDGLVGEEIPLAARIVSVCDAFEAMVADRPYRRGRPAAEAAAELVRCRGTQFDPAVVDAFCAEVVPGAALRVVA